MFLLIKHFNPVKRGANYQVIPVDKIFKSIRSDYKSKIEETLEKAKEEINKIIDAIGSI